MYNLLTLFVVHPHDKPSYSELCPIRVLITSICASPCPSFSRNSGRTSRRNPREDRKVGREDEIRGGTRDLGQRSLYSTLLSWLLSRGRVFHLPPSPFLILPILDYARQLFRILPKTVTMHNEVSPATEECWRRFIECIPQAAFTGKKLGLDTTARPAGINQTWAV